MLVILFPKTEPTKYLQTISFTLLHSPSMIYAICIISVSIIFVANKLNLGAKNREFLSYPVKTQQTAGMVEPMADMLVCGRVRQTQVWAEITQDSLVVQERWNQLAR